MDGEKKFLDEYTLSNYEKPSVTADIALFKLRREDTDNYRRDSSSSLSLLLIRRGEHPYKDSWALPGGFLQPQETIEECALREIYEETSMHPASLISVGLFSEAGRDPRGWIISNGFVSIIADTREEQSAGGDAADAQWFDVGFEALSDEMYALELSHGDIHIRATVREETSRFVTTTFRVEESDSIAFDHAAIIAKALTVLRNGAKDFDFIFDFLPEKFTLTQLQNVQETIMNVSVLSANFRRKVACMVEETDEYTSGHRPAKLYTQK